MTWTNAPLISSRFFKIILKNRLFFLFQIVNFLWTKRLRLHFITNHPMSKYRRNNGESKWSVEKVVFDIWSFSVKRARLPIIRLPAGVIKFAPAGKRIMGNSALFESGEMKKGASLMVWLNQQISARNFVHNFEGNSPWFLCWKRALFPVLPQISGKGEFESNQLLESLENIHPEELPKIKINKAATPWYSKLCA